MWQLSLSWRRPSGPGTQGQEIKNVRLLRDSARVCVNHQRAVARRGDEKELALFPLIGSVIFMQLTDGAVNTRGGKFLIGFLLLY
jgi:hypothetical protein